jgi:hypothetical protein
MKKWHNINLLQIYPPVYSININWAHIIHQASFEILTTDIKVAISILKKLTVCTHKKEAVTMIGIM